jgi:hypothetical protein
MEISLHDTENDVHMYAKFGCLNCYECLQLNTSRIEFL